MANILVMIEAVGGVATAASLQALGQARRIGTALGATVYAVLPLPQELPSGEGDLLALCGQRGADKVVLLADEPQRQSTAPMQTAPVPPDASATSPGSSADTPTLTSVPRAVRVLQSACQQLPPVLLLFGDSDASRALAGPLAQALVVPYLPGGSAEVGEVLPRPPREDPEVSGDDDRSAVPELRPGDEATVQLRYDEGPRLRLVLRDSAGAEAQKARCVVVTLPEGRYAEARGAEAEMLVIPALL